MSDFQRQASRNAVMLAALPAWQRLTELRQDLDPETISAVLDEAARFSEGVLAPLNTPADREGCRLETGRVQVPKGFKQAYQDLAAAGWIGMDVSSDLGGQDLPLALHAATQSLFDRGCTAVMMAAGASRSAALLLSNHADEDLKATWVPRLCSGNWSATICISEPDAGSDVARIRTRAQKTGESWEITGQKIWISFGDHDMTARIGHCLLARTSDQPGTRGLSLFLVPNTKDDGSGNGITIGRIEEKLGMHGSPTCTMSFEGAHGVLIGEEGRGLSTLFTMMELMRLQTGAQGLGLALGAQDIALAYARDRRQGGSPREPAPAIASHGDVRRQLLDMQARNAVLQMAVLDLSAHLDLIAAQPGAEDRTDLKNYTAWMLPLIKTFGAEAAFNTAHSAIQVLGGAGYTSEWPVEQTLRDARVLSIYEGTTGMQARDFLMRGVWREESAGLKAFVRLCDIALDTTELDGAAKTLSAIVSSFSDLSSEMEALGKNASRAGEYAADPYLRAGWCAVSALMAFRLSRMTNQPPLAALGRYRLEQLPAELAFEAAKCRGTSTATDDLFDLANP